VPVEMVSTKGSKTFRIGHFGADAAAREGLLPSVESDDDPLQVALRDMEKKKTRRRKRGAGAPDGPLHRG
jgi:hypothetical protein